VVTVLAIAPVEFAEIQRPKHPFKRLPTTPLHKGIEPGAGTYLGQLPTGVQPSALINAIVHSRGEEADSYAVFMPANAAM
jgi:hypothetical protein